VTHPSETLPPPSEAPEGDDRPGPAGDGSSWMRLAALVGAVVLLGALGGLPLLIVIVAIVVMIFLHELGHYVTAKWAGMKVTEFFLFFGPKVWSFRRGETEYGVKAIPAGAYVRIIGMHNLEEVPPEDEFRTYRQKPYWRRMSVAVAGSTMHFLVALVLLFVLFVGYGVSNDQQWEVRELTDPQDTLDALHPDVAAASPEAVRGLESGRTPASEAGLEPGDHIVSIGGQTLGELDDLSEFVQAHPGDEVSLVVERDGEQIETTTTLGTLSDGEEQMGWLGVSSQPGTEHLGPIDAARESAETFGAYTRESVAAIGAFFTPSSLSNFAEQAFTAGDDDPGDPSSPLPGASTSEDNRLISIVGAARIGSQATESGVELLLGFLVVINIFIGLFNMIPLLPFDGGHVAIATYEKVRELIRGGRERYYADVAKLMPLTYGVVAVLVTVGLMALYLDVANPVDLPQ